MMTRELNPSNTEIYRVGIGGGEIAALTDRNGPGNFVSVSPDGPDAGLDRAMTIGSAVIRSPACTR